MKGRGILRASSLVEVLVAMVLLTVIFSLALTIYINIIKQPFWESYVTRRSLEKVAYQLKKRNICTDGSVDLGGQIVTYKFLDYNESESFMKLRLECSKLGKIIARYEEVIPRCKD